MNIEHLREFAYLAETLSFNITAKHFFISQSVLSKHIMALEDDLGVPLFDRDRRHVELTEPGSLFYTDCLTVLNDYDRARERLSAARSGQSIALSVGYLRNAARPFLPHFVRYIEQEHPEVDLSVTCMEYGELIRAHRSHQVDAIITLDLDPEANDMCDFGYIYTDRLYAVVGKGHPLSDRHEGITLKDLEGQSCIFPRKEAYAGLGEFIESFAAGHLRAADFSFYRDIDTLFMRLERGDGIAFSSGHNIKPYGGRVVFLPVVDADTSYTVSARWFKTADRAVAETMMEATERCRLHMSRWDDGFSRQFTGPDS